jgi:hypothetical protein
MTKSKSPKILSKKVLYKNRLLILLIVTGLVLACGIFTYLYLQRDQTYNPNFSGQYVTANVPKGWEVKEVITISEDNKDVKGLWGIEIWHADKKIFELDYVNGVGGLAICSKIFKFTDTSSEFVNSVILADNTTLDPATPYTIVDLSQEKYLPVNLFGIDARIVYSNSAVNNIYLNGSSNSTVFNPKCDDLEYVAAFPKLTYASPSATDYPDTLHNYSVTYYSDGVSQDDATTLAGILNSLVQK